MEALSNLATGFSLSLVAGVNAYIPLLFLGLVVRLTGSDLLRPPFDLLSNEFVLAGLTLLLLAEVVADKLPDIGALNDTVQTVVRPLAGGLVLAAMAVSTEGFPPLLAFGVGIVGAGVVHGTKAGLRPMVTVHSSGRAVPMISVIEDAVAMVCFFVAMAMPLASVLLVPVVLVGFFWGLHHQWESRLPEAPEGQG